MADRFGRHNRQTDRAAMRPRVAAAPEQTRPLLLVELDEAIWPGGSSDATLLRYDADAGAYVTTADTIQIRSVQSTVDHSAPRRLWARYNPLAGKYEPIGAMGGTILGKTDADGVPGRAGDVPGSGSVDLFRLGDDGDLEPVVDSNGDQVTVSAHNISSGDVAGNAYVLLSEDWDGYWWVIVESCDDAAAAAGATNVLIGSQEVEIGAGQSVMIQA